MPADAVGQNRLGSRARATPDGPTTPRHRLAYFVAEVAELLGISSSAVRTLVGNGTLRVPGLGRTIHGPSHAVYALVGEALPPLAEPHDLAPPHAQNRAHLMHGQAFWLRHTSSRQGHAQGIGGHEH